MQSYRKLSGSRPQDIRRSNSRAMLNLLTDSENLTINELAEAMNLSRTAVQNILSGLLSNGMANEDAKRNTNIAGGKSALSYAINPEYKYCICLHTTTEYISAEVYNFRLSKVTFYVANSGGLRYIELLRLAAKAVHSLMTEVDFTPAELFGIVVSVSGMVDSERGVLIKPTGSDIASEWGKNLNFVDDLKAELAFDTDVSIYIDNLCNFGAFSMLKNNSYRYTKSFLYILAHPRGIGAALIKDGEIIKGDHGLMGEIGHTTIDYNSSVLCRCGKRGCFEAMLYPEIIHERIINAQKNGVVTSIEQRDQMSITDIFEAADRGDEFALSQVRIIAEQFAHILCNAQIMYDAEVVIFHEAFNYISMSFRELIKESLETITGGNAIFLPEVYFDNTDFNTSVRNGAAEYCREIYLANAETFA